MGGPSPITSELEGARAASQVAMYDCFPEQTPLIEFQVTMGKAFSLYVVALLVRE